MDIPPHESTSPEPPLTRRDWLVALGLAAVVLAVLLLSAYVPG